MCRKTHLASLSLSDPIFSLPYAFVVDRSRLNTLQLISPLSLRHPETKHRRTQTHKRHRHATYGHTHTKGGHTPLKNKQRRITPLAKLIYRPIWLSSQLTLKKRRTPCDNTSAVNSTKLVDSQLCSLYDAPVALAERKKNVAEKMANKGKQYKR